MRVLSGLNHFFLFMKLAWAPGAHKKT